MEKWIFFLKHASDLEVIPSHADQVALRTAYDIANRFQWSREELEWYEYWGIKAQDERGMVELAVQRERVATAKRMLTEGLSPELIMKCTGLSIGQIL